MAGRVKNPRLRCWFGCDGRFSG